MNYRSTRYLDYSANMYWLLGTSVQKKTDLAFPIALFPWHGSRWKDKGSLFVSLDGERKTPSSKTNRCLLAVCAPGSEVDTRLKGFFEGILTNDDDPLAHLDSLMQGRPSSLLFTPPFGSHGAARPKSERQPPWFLLAKWHEMIQRSRASASASPGVCGKNASTTC